jgi:hypothetical protein
MRAMAAVGLLGHDGEGGFSVTALGDLLREDVPGSLRAATFGIKYGRVFAELFRGHNPELDELGRRATLNLLACFERAVASHRGEVLRTDADAALATVSSTIISACIHRGVGLGIVSQGVSWPEYASRFGDMCYAYLTTPGP